MAAGVNGNEHEEREQTIQWLIHHGMEFQFRQVANPNGDEQFPGYETEAGCNDYAG